MKLQKIVVGTDFSEISLVAVERAFDLASTSGAHVDLVFVREIPVGPGTMDLPVVLGPPEPIPQVRFDAIIPEGLRRQTSTTVLDGVASHEISAFALEAGADLIVVGTHGHRGIKRLLLGSTAEALVREAPCDVLVARQRIARATEAPGPALAESTGGIKGGDPIC